MLLGMKDKIELHFMEKKESDVRGKFASGAEMNVILGKKGKNGDEKGAYVFPTNFGSSTIAGKMRSMGYEVIGGVRITLQGGIWDPNLLKWEAPRPVDPHEQDELVQTVCQAVRFRFDLLDVPSLKQGVHPTSLNAEGE